MKKSLAYLLCTAVFALCMLILSSCRPSGQGELQRRLQTLSGVSEIGTVEYKVKKIIKVDDDAWYKYGDRKILFSCMAYLKAGVDMSGFSADNVSIDKDRSAVTVTLPKAKLLSFNIPAGEIRQEISIVNGLRFDFTPEEKQQLLVQGQRAIAAEIEQMGILEDAEANSRSFFEALLSQMGYEKINVEFR